MFIALNWDMFAKLEHFHSPEAIAPRGIGTAEPHFLKNFVMIAAPFAYVVDSKKSWEVNLAPVRFYD